MAPLGKRRSSESSCMVLTVWLLALAPFAASATLGASAIRGIGVLGDSVSDEYRANDDRGGSYRATTLGWTEQLVFRRGLNFGPYANGANRAAMAMRTTGPAAERRRRPS